MHKSYLALIFFFLTSIVVSSNAQQLNTLSVEEINTFHELLVSGDSLDDLGERDKSFEAYQKAYQKAVPEGLWRVQIAALSRMANAKRRLKEPKECKNYLNQAIPIAKQHLDSADYVMGELNFTIGDMLMRSGKLDSSLHYLKLAEQIYENNFGEAHLIMVHPYQRLGDTYYNIGDFRKTLKYYEKASRLVQNDSNATDYNKALNYYRISVVNGKLGRTKKEILYMEKTISLVENKGQYSAFLSVCYSALANHYYLENSYQKAIEVLKKSLQLNKGAEAAVTHNTLSLIYRKKQNADSALFHIKKAIALKPNDAIYLLNYGWHLAELGKENQGIAVLKKAIFDYEQNAGKNSEKTSFALTKLSGVFAQMNQWDSALYYADDALTRLFPSMQEVKNQYPNESEIYGDYYACFALENKAKIEQRAGIYLSNPTLINSSLIGFQLCELGQKKLLAQKTFEASENKSFRTLKNITESTLRSLYELYKLEKDDNLIHQNKAFSLIDNIKGQRLIRQQQKYRHKEESRLLADLLTQEKRIRAKMIAKEFELSEMGKKDERQTTLQNTIFDYGKQLEKLSDSVKQIEEKIEVGSTTKDCEIKEIQHTIASNELILQFFKGKEHCYLLTISKNSSSFSQFPSQEIDSLLSEYISLLKQATIEKETTQEYKDVAHALYNKLLGDVLTQYPENINDLTIIPDGEISGMPFESLLLSTEGTGFHNFDYLIKHYTCNYQYSYALRQNGQNISIKNPSVLGFGYSQPSENLWLSFARSVRNQPFNEIPGSGLEIKYLSEITSGKFFLDKEASETKLKQEITKFPILHLAVHGKGDINNPYGSSLYFKDDNDSINDGIFHAYELLEYNLPTKLAVLSACETGIGKAIAGEGVYSMARAFMYSGCPAVVVSLWKANDQSSAKVMSSFYNELMHEEINSHDALRIAKISYLEKADEIEAHPANWAPFIGIGSKVIIQKESPKIVYLLFIALFLMLLVFLILFIKNKKREV